jgi:hypothetical protein
MIQPGEAVGLEERIGRNSALRKVCAWGYTIIFLNEGKGGPGDPWNLPCMPREGNAALFEGTGPIFPLIQPTLSVPSA